jgi:hypothetical protein
MHVYIVINCVCKHPFFLDPNWILSCKIQYSWMIYIITFRQFKYDNLHIHTYTVWHLLRGAWWVIKTQYAQIVQWCFVGVSLHQKVQNKQCKNLHTYDGVASTGFIWLRTGTHAGCDVHSNILCVPQNVRDLQKLKIASQEQLCSKELVSSSFQLFLQQTNVLITKRNMPARSHQHKKARQKTVL